MFQRSTVNTITNIFFFMQNGNTLRKTKRMRITNAVKTSIGSIHRNWAFRPRATQTVRELFIDCYCTPGCSYHIGARAINVWLVWPLYSSEWLHQELSHYTSPQSLLFLTQLLHFNYLQVRPTKRLSHSWFSYTRMTTDAQLDAV